MRSQLIKNALLVNEGRTVSADVRIKGARIDSIASSLSATVLDQVFDATGCYLMPGMIDDQVHFREPGLTHKGTIASESRAAVAGGITSYMEMPNVNPATTSQQALEDKYALAKAHSIANYAFYLGATEDNLDTIKVLDPKKICGVKVFMGASTGDLLVENPAALDAIFRESPVLIATHCEHGQVIQQNLRKLHHQGITPTIQHHSQIRDETACYASSSYAVALAKKHHTQLHVLHITTARELSLFSPGSIIGKHITAEACVHHLWFSDNDYARLGNLIKCNPAIKSNHDRQALLNALNSDHLDIIATDHAPHTWHEKQQPYNQAPAGLPLVEHALLMLIQQVHNGIFSIEKVVEKTAHNPALRYHIAERGFIREGYYADLVLLNPNATTSVTNRHSRYQCGWTPVANEQFSARIVSTWVNGQQVFNGDHILEPTRAAMPLLFNR